MEKVTSGLSLQQKAKIAGLLYLLLCIFGGWAHGGVRFAMIVYGDAMTTANNIRADESGFVFGIVADLIAQVIMVFLPLALYQLFSSVNKKAALLMVIAGYMGIPITCINMLNQIAAVLLLGNTEYLQVFTLEQLQALASFFLEMQKNGYLIAHIFFGLWLFPMGYLVMKSNFFPKFIGLWLILGGSVYLIQTFMLFLYPEYQELVSGVAGLTGLSEIVFCLWLLLKGVKKEYSIEQG